MPHPLIPVTTSLGGVAIGTALSEDVSLKSPKTIAAFYLQVAKSCYKATGSKRVACVVAAGACGMVFMPGPHQGPFIAACAATLRGANKL